MRRGLEPANLRRSLLLVHEQHMTAGMTGMKPLWAFVSETWKQHGIDPSNADAVRGIINRSYVLDKVRVVVCADEFSKPYGMLKQRCQKLHTLGPRRRMC